MDMKKIKTAAGLALAAQGLPPEASELLLDKLSDLDDLLLSTIQRNRAVAISAKVQAAVSLMNFGTPEMTRCADELLAEVSEDVFGEDEEESEEAGEPEPAPSPGATA